jgi:formylglycine-generating enzyme required for sulfatase activity
MRFFGGIVVLLTVLFGGWGNAMRANNLRLGTVHCDGRTLDVELAWDHAWNLDSGIGNHDAVWLFAKIKRAGRWEHLHFAAAASAHRVDEAGRIALDPDPAGLGLMLRTIQPGSGDIAFTHIHIQLAEPILAGEFELAVFGIEMAYVPEGPFWLGDGASNFCLRDSVSHQPYHVSSENALPADALHAPGANPPGGALPAAFPKGYGGFYLMKYEVSQQQYADFLTTLTPAQQAAHTVAGDAATHNTYVMAANPIHRNGIVLDLAPENESWDRQFVCNADAANPFDALDDGQNRACNWLAWPDLSAYLDWAALRPITELEFEKACRGPVLPLPREFAWGTDAVIDANTPHLDGTEAETVWEAATTNAGLASHGYAGLQGPLRCGFGANATSDRLQAGAGYYGHTELSGNLWEMCVNLRAEGLQFDGALGDGTLADDGSANVPTWPASLGVGYKGGGWNSGILPGFRDLAVSDRFYIGLVSDTRRATVGGRGGR